MFNPLRRSNRDHDHNPDRISLTAAAAAEVDRAARDAAAAAAAHSSRPGQEALAQYRGEAWTAIEHAREAHHTDLGPALTAMARYLDTAAAPPPLPGQYGAPARAARAAHALWVQATRDAETALQQHDIAIQKLERRVRRLHQLAELRVQRFGETYTAWHPTAATLTETTGIITDAGSESMTGSSVYEQARIADQQLADLVAAVRDRLARHRSPVEDEIRPGPGDRSGTRARP